MKPECASSNRLQYAQGNQPVHVFGSDGSTWSNSARQASTGSGERSRPLGLRRWTRHILEFVPLWLVLAALAGWFAYGCGGGSTNMSADCGFVGGGGSLDGKTSVAVGAEVQLSVPPSCLSSGESVSWIAFPTGYLSVDNNGNVTGLSATPPDITVTVTAVYTNGSGSANLTVTGPTLQSIAVTDVDNGAATVGEGDVFTATGTYSDASTQNLTNYVSWVSSVPAVADIATAPSSGPGGDPGNAGTLIPGDTLISAGVTIGSAPAITGLEILTVEDPEYHHGYGRR